MRNQNNMTQHAHVSAHHITLHCNASAIERGRYKRVLHRAYQWSEEELGLGGRAHDKSCGCLSKQVADVKRRTAEFDTSLHSGQQQRGGSQGGRRAADSQATQWYPVQIFTLSDKPRNTQFRGRADQIRQWHNGVRLTAIFTITQSQWVNKTLFYFKTFYLRS